MVVTVQNPDNIPNGITTGYQQQNNLLYMVMTGYANVFARDDVIKQGSVFELNGALIKVLDDEKINGLYPAVDLPNPPNNRLKMYQEYYVMAIPLSDTEVEFRIRLKPMDSSTDDVQWSQLKGGWYRKINSNTFSNERALIVATVDGEGNLVGARLMNNIVTNVNPNPTGGTEFFNESSKGVKSIFQQPGWVRFSISSGAGANATLGNGGNATAIRCGAGGGCGAGEESYILTNNGTRKFTTGHIKPGNGGNAFENSVTGFYGLGGKGILEDIPVLYNTFALGSNVMDDNVKSLLNLIRPIGNGENCISPSSSNLNSMGAMKGFGGLGIGGGSSSSRQFNFSTNKLDTISNLENPFTNGGTSGLGWGGGGAGGTRNSTYSTTQGPGSGGVASAKITLTGSFYHPGGLIIIYIGGNGYNGGTGGNQYSNASDDYYLSGGGGGGGAPGWFREVGSTSAGSCILWYIGQ